MLTTLAHAGHDHVQEAVSTLHNGGTVLVIAAVAVLLVALVVGYIAFSARRKAKNSPAIVKAESSDREDA